jgi:hypothetical protein
VWLPLVYELRFNYTFTFKWTDRQPFVGFQVFMDVEIHILLFSIMTPYSLVGGYKLFERILYLHITWYVPN